MMRGGDNAGSDVAAGVTINEKGICRKAPIATTILGVRELNTSGLLV